MVAGGIVYLIVGAGDGVAERLEGDGELVHHGTAYSDEVDALLIDGLHMRGCAYVEV